jgi:hypothetical protein
MTQTGSFQSAATHNRVPADVIEDATGGDIEAMTLIGRHYEPHIRRLATIGARGTSYLNVDLYDRLKTRLIVETLKFRI